MGGGVKEPTNMSSRDREKRVLWFAFAPPCLRHLWLPVKQSTNLAADKIPLMSTFCLLTYSDNNLSQLYLSFSFFFFFFATPAVRLRLLTYLIMDFYSLF